MEEHPSSSSNMSHRNKKNQNMSKIDSQQIVEWSLLSETELMLEVIAHKMDFQEYLENHLTPDQIVLVVKILTKLTSSALEENKIEAIHMAGNEKFIENIEIFVMKLPLQTVEDRELNQLFWNDVEEFFNNLFTLLNSIIDVTPTRACEVLQKLVKALSFLAYFETEQNIELSNDTKVRINRLKDKLELNKIELEERKNAIQVNENNIEEQPPDDFRNLSVYPLSEEINNSKRPFLRKHIIKGRYENVEHYLDVQFRLLKEDFIAPLREGVCNYLHRAKPKSSRITDIRIHTQVIFKSTLYDRNQIGVIVEFNLSKKESLINSKRFMYGSLVCFTNDDFQTFLFGRIIDRDMRLLSKGEVIIGFHPKYNNYKLNTPYVMIECNVFFEPYYHVLNALQNMPDDDFPMKNYLIDVNPVMEFPGYLDESSSFTIKKSGESTILSISDTWPTALELGLDDTQYSAYKAALTNKFAVIQGPPGTGKTYLGLKIIKTLIENKSHWFNGTPILIICFTNHALDQFLEGLISVTNKIVRVGGQSKNEKLAPFYLKNQQRAWKYTTNHIHAFYAWKKALDDVMNDIKVLLRNKQVVDQFDTIFNFRDFRIVDPKIENSWFNTASSEDMFNWLFSRSTPQNPTADIVELEANLNNNNKDDNTDADIYLNNLLKNALKAGIHDVSVLCSKRSVGKLNSVTSINYLHTKRANIWNNIEKMNKSDVASKRHINFYVKRQVLQNETWDLTSKLHYLKMRFSQRKNMEDQKKPRNTDYDNPQNMHPDERWQLYFHWVYLYKRHIAAKLVNLQHQQHKIFKKFEEIKNIKDAELMKEQLIVGMTTTGAARLQTTLQALKCQIVLVEEAAEVLECHITVALTKHCNHLILIGDHQQLRPSTATYRMEKDFNLGISMFERMVLNNIQCHSLGVQHRMRPEIAKLISPNIYPKLQNHHSVYNFPPVLGVDSCLYFIDHRRKEIEATDSSKANIHEAQFLLRLASYFRLNAYEAKDITILAAYSGQMFCLSKERNAANDDLLKDVKITILDNYQGEECKIILLSLVRNNDDNKIGFLKIVNRVCVALSRAKEGLYIMGNMDLLSQNSDIWLKIKYTLEEQRAIGTFLALSCHVHPEEKINATDANSFDKAPEGGCRRDCKALLACQHFCTKICHILDREHANFKCEVPCERQPCKRKHSCPKLCFEDCGECMVIIRKTLDCGHEHDLPCHTDITKVNCKIPIAITLPCGHSVDNKPCFIKAEEFSCPYPCTSRVEPCGHACRLTCHIANDPYHLEYECLKPCPKMNKDCSSETHKCPKFCHETCSTCEVTVRKARINCAHDVKIACSKSVDEVTCLKFCGKKLPCGHICKRKCFEDCGGCSVMVWKILETCGHQVITKCSASPNKKDCNGACPLKLKCGHFCQNKCKEPCSTKNCFVLIDNATTAVACGHKFKIPCWLTQRELASNSYELLKYCTEPCSSTLKCSHACSGTCAKCYQGRIHQTCKEKCGVSLICGHECSSACVESCLPCEQPCLLKCKHGKCKRKCKEVCSQCRKPCLRRCPHVKCKAPCGARCTVPPCDKPCHKKLRCGHPCVGFCGDPCPPLCKLCDKDELTEILLKGEDIIEAKFVLLDECKHVIQFKIDESHSSKEVSYMKCPKCNTIIISTQRYRNFSRQVNQDVIKMKKKLFGTYGEIQRKRKMIQQNIKKLLLHANRFGGIISSRNAVRCSTKIPTFLKELEIFLQKAGYQKQQQPLNLIIASALEAKIQIVKTMLNIFKSCTPNTTNLWLNTIKYVDLLANNLFKNPYQITNQEISDFNQELLRLKRMKQFIQIVNSKTFKAHQENSEVVTLRNNIETLLFKPVKYENNYDVEIKDKLAELNKLTKSNVDITDFEIQEKVSFLRFQKGRWFKCSNDHYYVITDSDSNAGRCHQCNEVTDSTNGTSQIVSGEIESSLVLI